MGAQGDVDMTVDSEFDRSVPRVGFRPTGSDTSTEPPGDGTVRLVATGTAVR